MPRTLLVAALTLGLARAAAGQEPLSLQQATALTLAHHPALRAADAGGREADERLHEARAGYWPTASIVESWQRGDQPVFVFGSLLSQRRFSAEHFAIDALNHPDPLNNFRTLFAVEQPIFDGARTPASVRAAQLGQTIAELDRARLAADLTLATTEAYGRVLQAQAARHAADAAVVAAEEDLRRAQRRRDAGLETDASVLALDVQLAQMRERQIRATSDEDVARVELNQAMGVELERIYTLSEPVVPAREPLDLPALEAAAVATRPELRRAEAERSLADASRGVAKSALLPHVSVQAGLELDGATFGDRASAWLVGTQVSWTLFSGGATQARLRQATFAAERAAAERDRLEAAVRVEVRASWARLNAAGAREIIGRRAVEQARESQRIIRDRYDAGLAPASELLRANTSVLDADALRTGALVDLLVSAAALERATGRNAGGRIGDTGARSGAGRGGPASDAPGGVQGSPPPGNEHGTDTETAHPERQVSR